jgi:hypothetical protein
MSIPDLKQMSTADLDALLESISLERAKREPPVAMEQPQKMEAAFDPKWYVSLTGPNTILQLRHPGFGWVGYVIPPPSRAALATFLLQHSLMPPAPAAAPPNAPPPAASSGGGTVH